MKGYFKQIVRLEKKIGLIFKDKKIVLNAFVHRSFLNEHKDFPLPSNEKMEFLGDSILSLACSLFLFQNFQSYSEGEYTEIKAALVKTETLAKIAKKLDLDEYLLLSKGQEKNEGRNNINILAGCFEAFICAIFLNFDFQNVYDFLTRAFFEKEVAYIIKNNLYSSAKTKLQEQTQKRYSATPVYQVVEEKGPPHNKTFKINVFLGKKNIGTGLGKSKKEAEENAAKKALDFLKNNSII